VSSFCGNKRHTGQENTGPVPFLQIKPKYASEAIISWAIKDEKLQLTMKKPIVYFF
jgi:hypothetical protein